MNLEKQSTPSISSDLAWVMWITRQGEEILATTTRFRVVLYTAISDYDEGLATATEIISGQQALGALILKWYERYKTSAEIFVLDFVPDPRF